MFLMPQQANWIRQTCGSHPVDLVTENFRTILHFKSVQRRPFFILQLYLDAVSQDYLTLAGRSILFD